MYACLHTPSSDQTIEELLDLALEFSPVVEQTSSNTVVFPIAGLRKLIGSPHQIASEICRNGYERKLQANLAITSNPDASILLARALNGVTLVTPGEEHFKISSIPLRQLFLHDVSADPKLLQVLSRWGIKTCGELAAISEQGVAERLGKSGIYLRNLALGKVNRPLRVSMEETNYEGRLDLEDPVALLEPLLFLLGRTLSELCGRLQEQSQAARLLEGNLFMDSGATYTCQLEFPVPLNETGTILKLLQLHLERHPPAAAIIGFTLRVEPIDPRRVQGGLFVSPTPAADKLQVTLARIAGMVGEDNVGTPTLLNTHRPDAFRLTALNTTSFDVQKDLSSSPSGEAAKQRQKMLRLAMRLFRPALPARVRIAGATPKKVTASGVEGTVMRSAGPWKISGEWWTSHPWNREEWDVALDDGALYRIYCVSQTHEWYVHGIYD